MNMNLAQLKNSVTCLSHRHIGHSVLVSDVVTDSRKVTPGCLFVAILGEKYDAHDFLEDVVRQGAAGIVVEHVAGTSSIPALVVPDTRIALGEIAHYWRTQFNLPIIAVTGSNGKTTVKEMIASILTANFGSDFTLATKGNLNNDIGVPQTLFRLDEKHRAAVVELGMNHPGEIARLTATACPTVGLVNNAQREHQEFMQSVEAVAKENGAVLQGLPEDGVAVFPANDTFSELWRGYAGKRKIITFGLDDGQPKADISGSFQPTVFGSKLIVKFLDTVEGEQTLPIALSVAGTHNVLNALAAIASCRAIGCTNEAIVEGLQGFQPVSGRMQKKQAHNSAVIIDDTYNANPDSVRAAIDVLAQITGEKILVLGDMGEVGADGPSYHAEIGRYARQKNIDMLMTLGQLAHHSTVAFGADLTGASSAMHFEHIDALLKQLDEKISSKTTILIKGSRFMKMERVVMHLTSSER